ncbi:protein cereblon isoform X1 [Diachasma alloeum]|uniref:protein cereblon isoform X1 n=1 Tax=Diachasma alloeum TaxID=454923 RepID=UPI000738161C|nr:protein cereblon isoform X1 [Diachasma alloeum]
MYLFTYLCIYSDIYCLQPQHHKPITASSSTDSCIQPSPGALENTFDMTLATSHSYLGNDLEVLRGRTLLDNGIYMDLPLLAEKSVVLFPGQTLPMMEYDIRTIEMLRKCINKDKTFGVACLRYDRGFSMGTTAEIYEYSENTGSDEVRVKAKGRQRFKILRIRSSSGRISADVKILPEIELGPPFHEDRLACLDRLRVIPTNEKEAKSQDKVARLDSVLTPWPAWVYHQYNPRRLAMKIHHYLRFVRSRGINIPTDPTELSFWVAQNLIMKDNVKISLLELDCAIQRLQVEVKLLAKLQEKLFVCSDCRTVIAKQVDVFPMNTEGIQSAYCNPHGAIHETVTVHRAQSLVLRQDPPSTECSWFPGYAWTIANCARCGYHKGWKFTATRSDLIPKSFWGLTSTGFVWGDPDKNEDDDDEEDCDDSSGIFDLEGV